MRLGLLLIATVLLALVGTGPVVAGIDDCGDCDMVPAASDNCLEIPNGPAQPHPQCDTDQDGYGNVCDPDVNNDGVVNVADYVDIDNNIFGTTPPGADTNCDGVINVGDYPLVDNNIFGTPGPSGLACAGTIPCP